MSQQNKTFGQTLAQQVSKKGTQVAEWKHDPLALLGGHRLLQNPDPDAKASLDRYMGKGRKAWQKYGEFLEPRKPGQTMHQRDEDETVPLSYAKGGKVIKSERY